MLDTKIINFKQRPNDRDAREVSQSIPFHSFFIYILYGLFAVVLCWVMSIYYPIMPYFYLVFSFLLMYFFFGLILLRIIQKYNKWLASTQKINEQLVQRLHSNIVQEAQQLKLAALGRFSASIAHELRNPLGAIAHAIQLLGEDGQLNPEDTHLKELVIKNCDRMNAVIKNVLQLSRSEQAQPQLIEIRSFLEQFRQDFCHANACDLKISLTDDKHMIWFDKSQLEQVLVILCDNSMQHGDNEGVVHITLSMNVNEDNTVLMVSDLGKGIPEEHKNKIFEPFFTTLRGGTGMGLFIARDLCEINQARLDLKKTTKSSCFVITINSSDE
jgi:signal transduction histidine kinase